MRIFRPALAITLTSIMFNLPSPALGETVTWGNHLAKCEILFAQGIYEFYNRTQLEYNLSTRPTMVFPGYKTAPMNYWEIPSDHPGVIIFGNPATTPIRAANGKYRVYANNPLDEDSRLLWDEYPKTQLPTAMQSSKRTFSVLPPNDYPFFIKQSYELTGKPRPTKRLNQAYISKSILRSLRFHSDPEILTDRAAMIFKAAPELGEMSAVHLFIYRDGHFTRALTPPPNAGDTLALLSVLLSYQFLSSQEAQQRFPSLLPLIKSSGVLDKEGASVWAANVVGPMLADIIYKSIFEAFTHFEVHTQNIDALFNKNEQRVMTYIRDLHDSVDDPMMAAVSGQEIPMLEESSHYGYLNQLDAPFQPRLAYWLGVSFENWYTMWLPEVRDAANFSGDKGGVSLLEEVATKRLVSRFKDLGNAKSVDWAQLEQIPEFKTVSHPAEKGADFISVGEAIRDLWIKYQLQIQVENGRETERAQRDPLMQELLRAKVVIASSNFTGTLADFHKLIQQSDPYSSTTLSFGRIGKHAFVLVKINGVVTYYFTAFN